MQALLRKKRPAGVTRKLVRSIWTRPLPATEVVFEVGLGVDSVLCFNPAEIAPERADGPVDDRPAELVFFASQMPASQRRRPVFNLAFVAAELLEVTEAGFGDSPR